MAAGGRAVGTRLMEKQVTVAGRLRILNLCGLGSNSAACKLQAASRNRSRVRRAVPKTAVLEPIINPHASYSIP